MFVNLIDRSREIVDQHLRGVDKSEIRAHSEIGLRAETRTKMTNSYAWAHRLGLQQGDRLLTPKSNFQVVRHHSLYVGVDAVGEAWVIENVVNQGVKWTRLDHLIQRAGYQPEVERFRGTYAQRTLVVNRALDRLGLPYNVLSYNCEHFVNEVQHGRRHSSQVDSAMNVLGGALTFMLIVAVVRNL